MRNSQKLLAVLLVVLFGTSVVFPPQSAQAVWPGGDIGVWSGSSDGWWSTTCVDRNSTTGVWTDPDTATIQANGNVYFGNQGQCRYADDAVLPHAFPDAAGNAIDRVRIMNAVDAAGGNTTIAGKEAGARELMAFLRDTYNVNDHTRTGSSFVIHTLLGRAQYATGNNRLDPGSVEWGTAETRLVSLASQGLVDFDVSISNATSFFDPGVNTGYRGGITPGGSTDNGQIISLNQSHTRGGIRIRDPVNTTRTVYAIWWYCANPIGSIGLPDTGPANYAPRSSVDSNQGNSSTAYVYKNPGETAALRHWNFISGHNGINHAIQGWAHMQINGGGWFNLHRGDYTASGNGDTDIYGTAVAPQIIGPGLTVPGFSVGLPGNSYTIPATAYEICSRLDIVPGGANLSAGESNPTAGACLRMRAGQTLASASAPNNYIEIGQSSDLLGQIITSNYRSFNGATGANYTANCTYAITITPGSSAGSNNGSISGGATSGSCSQTISGNGTLTPVTRTYTTNGATRIGSQACISVTVTVPAGLAGPMNPSGVTTASACIAAVAKPYFKAFAGDVRAGCNANGATISGWNQGSNAFAGAGGAFAAFALGNITEFASGQGGLNTPGFAAVPKGLTFASNNASTYGGSFSSGTCVLDYFGARPAASVPGSVLTKTIADGNFDGSDYTSANTDGASEPGIRQAFYSSGNVSFTGGSLTAGANTTVYVAGNVYIANNITMASAGGSATNIPRLTIVACGNIAISPTVGRLDAVLIAQAQTASANCDTSTPNGQIYTCGTSAFSLNQVIPTTYNVCNNQLVVNGSLIANKIFFTRTYGTAASHGSAPADFLRGGNGAGRAAEIIQYNPLNWVQPGEAGFLSPGTTRYDAITTLPPVL